MDDLPSDVRSLIQRTRRHDGPNARDKERVSQKLNVALAAAGSAAGLLATKSVTAATAVVSGEVALAGSAASTSVALVEAATAVGTATGVGAVGGAAGVATSAGVAAGAGSVGVGTAVGVTAGKAAVAPLAIVASKWGGSTVAVWLIGAGVVGAGATLGAPQVVSWVNTSDPQVEPPRAVALNVPSAARGVMPPNFTPERLAPAPSTVVISKGESAKVPANVELPSAPTPTSNEHSTPATNLVPNKASANSVAERPSSSGNDAAAEVALLGQAQRALVSGDGAQSIALLNEHAKRFPKSAFGVERAAARVFAYCQLGKVDEARAAARVFFRSGTSSPLTPRVQASCIKASEIKDTSTNIEQAGD